MDINSGYMLDIIFSILAAVCYGISASIQKYSFQGMKKFSIRRMIKNIRWLSALGIGFIGILIYLYALQIAALSVVQPMLALSMIIPIIFGIFFFGEKTSVHEIMGIILVIVGVVWISIF